MSISNTNPSAKDVVIIQRNDDNTQYNETHISGAKVILHIDNDGYVTADNSASFYDDYPPPMGESISSSISASWASHSLSSSWSPFIPNNYSVSSSWASQSLSASYITSSNIYGTIIALSSSWSSASISASYAPVQPTYSASAASLIYSASLTAASASWASSSLSTSYIAGINVIGTVASSTQSLYSTQSVYATQSLSSSIMANNTNAAFYLAIVTSSSGQQPLYVGTSLTYNPSTNQLSGSNLGISGSLYGTSSFSITSSYALTASHIYPFVGMTTTPTISASNTTPSGSIYTISTGSVNLCLTADGTGDIKNFNLNSASFAITTSFIDPSFIVAAYNNGNPQYIILENRNNIDDIQTTLVFTVLNGATSTPVYSGWDQPGLLLSDKEYRRIQSVNGVEREAGLVVGYIPSTNSGYITITDGYVWQGVNRIYLSAVSSSVDRTVLISHSGSSEWSGSLITELIYNQYDTGTGLASLGNKNYVNNFIYKTDVNTSATLVMLGGDNAKLADAIAEQPPTPPAGMKEYSILVGRIICWNTSIVAERIVQADSAFTTTFVPAGITDHNLLNNLQGGIAGQYYHLTSAEYTNLQAGSSSWASASISASYAPIQPAYSASAALLIYSASLTATSASWASASLSSSYAQNVQQLIVDYDWHLIRNSATVIQTTHNFMPGSVRLARNGMMCNADYLTTEYDYAESGSNQLQLHFTMSANTKMMADYILLQ